MFLVTHQNCSYQGHHYVQLKNPMVALSLFCLTCQHSIGLSIPSSLSYCLHLSSKTAHSVGCPPLTQVIPSKSPLPVSLAFKQRMPKVGLLVLFCVYTHSLGDLICQGLKYHLLSHNSQNYTFWPDIFPWIPGFYFQLSTWYFHMYIPKKHLILFKIKLPGIHLKCVALALFPI